jgi:group I intron endonuclease
MQNLWNKYGDDCFTFETIEETEDNVDILNDREIFWMKEMNTMFPNGMNFLNGGGVRSPSEITRKRMSDAKSGKNNPFYEKRHSEKTKKMMSENNVGMSGKHHSEESKKKQSESHIGLLAGKNSPNYEKKGTDSSTWGIEHPNSSSKYYGVSFHKQGNFWVVTITMNGKTKHIGTFKTEILAAQAYNDYVIKNNLPNPLNEIIE